MSTATTERPTLSHYRTYAPKPFTRAERDSVTILFGGLHWRVERILQAVLESGGNKAEVLPVATKEDLLTGRETADIGQCCPTSFTTGNLVNFLKKKSSEIGAEEVNKKFVYLTAGSCGACRFGQYHQSYELGLRNSGLEAFRMFLLAQDQLDQKAAMGEETSGEPQDPSYAARARSSRGAPPNRQAPQDPAVRVHRTPCSPPRRRISLDFFLRKLTRLPEIQLVGQHWPMSAVSRPVRRSSLVATGSTSALLPPLPGGMRSARQWESPEEDGHGVPLSPVKGVGTSVR